MKGVVDCLADEGGREPRDMDLPMNQREGIKCCNLGPVRVCSGAVKASAVSKIDIVGRTGLT